MMTPKTARNVWAVVFGTADTGPLNQLIDIRTRSDLAQFEDSPLTRAVEVVLKYGPSVMAVRYDSSEAFALLDTIASLDRLPHAVILPGGPEFEEFANKCRDNSYLGIVDYIGTASDLLAERQTDSGYGLKSMYLAIAFPAVTAGEQVEYLSAHLGGLICRAVQLDGAVSGEVIRGATGVTFSVTTEQSDSLVQAGVITVGPGYTIRGGANSLLNGDYNQDAVLLRPVIEGVILRDVRRFLASRIGSPVNLQIARSMASEISVYLAGRPDITGGFATFLEYESTITDTTAHLVYKLNVTLPTGTNLTTDISFDP